MALWHGYILLLKPGAWSAAMWQDAIACAESILEEAPADASPARQWHYRLRPDGLALVAECLMETADLSTNTFAQLMATCLQGKGHSITWQQVRSDLSGNVTVWRQGETWELSRQDALAYLTTNAVAWNTGAA